MIEPVEIKGVKFRVIQTFGTTYYKRGSAFAVHAAAYSLGMDRDTLRQGMKKIIEAANQGKLAEVAGLAMYIDALLADDHLLRPLLKMASTFILLDLPESQGGPEDPYNLSPLHDAKKLQLCEAHPDIEFFFASRCVDFLKLINALSKDTKVEDYLRKDRSTLEESLLQKIGNGIYKA